MSIKNRRELQATREKLAWLEKEHDSVKNQSSGNPHTQQLTLRSLKAMINQLKEEIACFEAHAGASANGS
jgi:septal ring factor EnvC (AmiA/AmiB activator)